MENENNTQWNHDYTLEETLAGRNDETYGYDDEIDEYQVKRNKNIIKNGNRKVIIQLILVVLLVIIVICSFILFKHLGQTEENEQISDSTTSVDNNVSGDAFFNENINIEDDYNMLNVDFNNNKENHDNTSQADAEKGYGKDFNEENLNNQEAEPVVVSWNSNLRQNPFKPLNIEENSEEKYETYGDLQFEIIEPPTKLVPDDNLTKLLQTQISGILYDETSPSAIINLDGQDQFVKVGDVISGYRIKKITKTKVEISYNHNTYIASVGELFTRGKLDNESGIVNLGNKFAGRYKKENVEE